MSTVLSARGLERRFVGGDGAAFTVLAGADLEVHAGEVLAIVGASGSGKSTLLHVLGGLDRPDAGSVSLEGVELTALEPAALATMRNRRLGFVFQFHHLLRDFSAAENVAMPLRVGGVGEADADRQARRLLERVGLAERADARATVLSGGEQQRVALARALVTTPAVLLADEPTGNLDPPTADRMHDLLVALAREHGTAVVVVTHNPALAARADRVLRLDGGQLQAALATGAAS